MDNRKFVDAAMENEVIANFMASLLQSQTDKYKYREIAMESLAKSLMANPNLKASLINKLYKDIIAHSSINFGKIPNSKGDLTKYEYYDAIYDEIKLLNKLYADVQNKPKELVIANKLHNMIITCRNDFEYGYRYDIDIIKTTYCLLVIGLYEISAICVAKYADYIKHVRNIDFKMTFVTDKQHMVVQYCNYFISAYEKGEWKQLMKAFKSNSKNLMGVPIVGFLASHMVISSILAIFSIIIIIRVLAYLYYYSASNINFYINNQLELLRYNNAKENSNVNDRMKKTKDLENFFITTSNFIETRIIKTENKATSELIKTNSKEFSKDELKKMNEIDNELEDSVSSNGSIASDLDVIQLI